MSEQDKSKWHYTMGGMSYCCCTNGQHLDARDGFTLTDLNALETKLAIAEKKAELADRARVLIRGGQILNSGGSSVNPKAWGRDALAWLEEYDALTAI